MKSKFLASLITILCLATAPAYADAPSADQVLAAAKTRAATENKTIFVHFGASWCGWCQRLDGFLERPVIKPVFEKYFIPIELVVQEDDPHKKLENPGADALLTKLGGAEQGIPYSVFLDAKGVLIVNSKRPSAGAQGGVENICYPGTPEEV